jgi:hypothetical protein
VDNYSLGLYPIFKCSLFETTMLRKLVLLPSSGWRKCPTLFDLLVEIVSTLDLHRFCIIITVLSEKCYLMMGM